MTVLLCLSLLIGSIPVMADDEISGAAINIDGFQRPIERPDAGAIKIKTADDLSNVRNDMLGSYVLMNDIDMSELSSSWKPIGDKDNPFKGKLDGQGFSIKNFSFRKENDSGFSTAMAAVKSSPYATGLFGVLNGAEIKNTKIDGASVSSTYNSGYTYSGDIDGNHGIYVGILAAKAENATVIYNCLVSGSASNSSTNESVCHAYSGGFVAWADSSAFGDCCFIGSTVSSSTHGDTGNTLNCITGGLVGKVTGSSIIERSYNVATVTAEAGMAGNSYAGGLVGYAQGSSISIKNSFNSGTVAATGGDGMLSESDVYCGGMAGVLTGMIENTYNLGNINANSKELIWGGGGKAYAGGLVGSFSGTCSVKSSVLAATSITASSGSSSNKSSIGNGVFSGENNIQTDKYSGSGAISAADASLKKEELYTDTLGWDFETCWEIPGGEGYPILKTELSSSEAYKAKYVQQHIDFANSNTYHKFLNENRWAQIYWSEENNFVSNAGEALYHLVDGAVDILSLDIKGLIGDIAEEDSYKLILADYVNDQITVSEIEKIQKIEMVKTTEKGYKKFKSFIEDHWKDSWGELSDEDLFWLYYYHEAPSDYWITIDFENKIESIVQDTKDTAESIDVAFGLGEKFIEYGFKAYDNIVDNINGMLEFSAELEAYSQSEQVFKDYLVELANNLPSDNMSYQLRLKMAINSYVQYNDLEEDDLSKVNLYFEYLKKKSAEGINGWIKDKISKGVSNWIKNNIPNITNKAVSMAASGTWKFMECATKNGKLMDCRNVLRKNAYFEDATYNTLQVYKDRLLSDPSYENAIGYNYAFSFLKEAENKSVDTVIDYFETYQTGWIPAIRNTFSANSFVKSAIEEALMNKLFVYRTYCHGNKYLVGGKIITVACPTDVVVYDSSENTVLSVVDGEIKDNDDSIPCYSSDGIKMFALPDDNEYTVDVNATGDGLVDLSVTCFDNDGQIESKEIWRNVHVNNGDTIHGDVRSITEGGTVVFSDNNTIPSTTGKLLEETNEHIESLTIMPLNNEMVIGDTVDLTVSVVPSSAKDKIMWKSLSSNIVQVSEDGELKAIDEGKAEIMAYSLYSRAFDKIEVTIKKPNNKTDPVFEAPKAKILTYNGSEQELIQMGSITSGGDILYSKTQNGIYSTDIPTEKNAGDYTVYYKITETDEVNGLDPVPVNVSITKKSANVKADNKTKVNGVDDPELTATITGMVNGEGKDLISYSISREEGEDVGTYVITVSGESKQGNYDVSYEPGSFFITETESSYVVTVTNDGCGTGEATPESGKTGTEITLTAYPNAGYIFKEWKIISGGVDITDNKLVLGTENVEIKAIFESESLDPSSPSSKTYLVNVIDGSGGGNYEAGDTVCISANPAVEGKEFEKWICDDGVSFGDENAVSTTFIMPDKDVTVKAKYKEKSDSNQGGNEKEDSGKIEKINKIPPINASDRYASTDDNFAAVQKDGSIKKLILDFSNVSKSDVAPSDLYMTVIKGSKCVTAAKLKDKGSATATGGVKVKINKKTLIATVTCTKNGNVTLTMDDGNTYTVSFRVQKPKAQRSAKNMSKGGSPAIKTIRDLFGTDIDAGELKVLKQKHSQATVSDNTLVVDPKEKDSIKVQYQYLNKKYKLTMKVK